MRTKRNVGILLCCAAVGFAALGCSGDTKKDKTEKTEKKISDKAGARAEGSAGMPARPERSEAPAKLSDKDPAGERGPDSRPAKVEDPRVGGVTPLPGGGK